MFGLRGLFNFYYCRSILGGEEEDCVSKGAF